VTYAPESMKRIYATDLTDAEWKALEPHVPAPNKRGRPRTHSPREILDCRVLHLEEQLSLAATPSRFPALGDRLLVLREMEDGRHLRAAQCRPARAVAGSFGQGSAPERGHRRLPVDKDDRGWRRAEGIRRQQEG
jgi:transposase